MRRSARCSAKPVPVSSSKLHRLFNRIGPLHNKAPPNQGPKAPSWSSRHVTEAQRLTCIRVPNFSFTQQALRIRKIYRLRGSAADIGGNKMAEEGARFAGPSPPREARL